MSHALVICAKRYNGHELWVLLGVLQDRGHTFEVVSQERIIRDELTLQPNTINRVVWDVDPAVMSGDSFDGIIVVSGNMQDTEAYWDDPHVAKLLTSASTADKTIGAICCSVPTLAPVAAGKRVSHYPLVRARHRLKIAGAIPTGVVLTVDGRMITAEHQMASQMWALEICNVLEGKPQQFHFTPTGFMPLGTPRHMDPEVEAAIEAAKLRRKMAAEAELGGSGQK